MYLPFDEFCNVTSFFLCYLFFKYFLLLRWKKTKTNDKNKNIEFETQKRSSCEKSKKMSPFTFILNVLEIVYYGSAFILFVVV